MFDIIIKNGRVVDGCGNPWFKADVGISKGKIERICRLRSDAERVVDAENSIVCPGFIDVHTHSELELLVNPTADSHVHQGITTDIIGNCGVSVAPPSDFYKERAEKLLHAYNMVWSWKSLAEFLEILEKRGISINVASLVGQSAVRAAVMGAEKRPPTSRELDRMKELVAEGMEQGAFGMSTGLFYVPGGYASTQEVIELAKVAAKYGGIYVTHMRSEGDNVIDALGEALEIGMKANLPVQISHFKGVGPANWGKIRLGLRLMEEARERGLDVTCDAYPWIAGVTPLIDYLPRWSQEGGITEVIRRLKDSKLREKIINDMGEGGLGEESIVREVGWNRIMISTSSSHPEYEGKTIGEIVNSESKNPYDLIFDVMIQDKSEAIVIDFWGREEEVEEVLKNPLTMVCSDSSAITPKGPLGSGKPHPRYYGNVPKLLSDYVRKRKALTMEEAIRKVTTLPAQRLGFRDRGQIKEGVWADIVVFDMEEVEAVGVFGDPHHFPKGIKWVLVNGVVTIEEGKHTSALAGKTLRKHF